MKSRIRIFLFALTVNFPICTAGQDLQNAQFFAIPVWMNPAFAGNMEFDCKELRSSIRGSMLSRRQWSAFNSDALALELYRKKSRMGYALLVQSERAAGASFRNSSAGLAVSYRLSLGENWLLASGLQAAMVQRSFYWKDLRFTDQFSDKGFTGFSTVDNQPENANPVRMYADFSAGSLLFTRLFWTGVSVQHLSQPILSDFSAERLPLKISIHAGYKFEFRSAPNFGLFRQDISLHPVWQLRIQGPFSQMDGGLYYNHEPFIAGILYRGMGILKRDADQLFSQDAAVFLLGLKRDGFRLGYSMEVNLKRKSQGGLPTQEISLAYQYAKKGCLRRRFGKWISVPSF